MLKDEITHPLMSSYNAPIVTVTKKDGSTRFCIDYRKPNKVSREPKYPLPSPAACFDELGNAYYFSSIGLASVYWSVLIEQRV